MRDANQDVSLHEEAQILYYTFLCLLFDVFTCLVAEKKKPDIIEPALGADPTSPHCCVHL